VGAPIAPGRTLVEETEASTMPAVIDFEGIYRADAKDVAVDSPGVVGLARLSAPPAPRLRIVGRQITR